MVHAAADGHPIHHQRTFVHTAANHALDGLKAVDVVHLKFTLNARFSQTANVLLHKAGVGGHDHVFVGFVQVRKAARHPSKIIVTCMLCDVHLRGVDCHRHLVWTRLQLSQHVARIVGQPFGLTLRAFGCKADGAPHLNDHFRNGFAHTRNQLIEFGQAFAALAIIFTHMQVQHRGPCFVAVNRLLNLLGHGDGNVFRKIRRNPTWRIRGRRDDQGLLVLRIKMAV